MFVNNAQYKTVYCVRKITQAVKNVAKVLGLIKVDNVKLVKTQIVKNVDKTLKYATLVKSVMLKILLISV